MFCCTALCAVSFHLPSMVLERSGVLVKLGGLSVVVVGL